GQTDLLRRLRGEIGPRQPIEARGQPRRSALLEHAESVRSRAARAHSACCCRIPYATLLPTGSSAGLRAIRATSSAGFARAIPFWGRFRRGPSRPPPTRMGGEAPLRVSARRASRAAPPPRGWWRGRSARG